MLFSAGGVSWWGRVYSAPLPQFRGRVLSALVTIDCRCLKNTSIYIRLPAAKKSKKTGRTLLHVRSLLGHTRITVAVYSLRWSTPNASTRASCALHIYIHTQVNGQIVIGCSLTIHLSADHRQTRASHVLQRMYAYTPYMHLNSGRMKYGGTHPDFRGGKKQTLPT